MANVAKVLKTLGQILDAGHTLTAGCLTRIGSTPANVTQVAPHYGEYISLKLGDGRWISYSLGRDETIRLIVRGPKGDRWMIRPNGTLKLIWPADSGEALPL